LSREILALKRREDGIFEIYADGELVEEYEANKDTWGALLPIKLWRHFNNIVERRIKTMTKRCRHQWEQKPDYPEDIICRKCETIKKVSELTRQQFLKLPLELRRSLLSLQAEGMIAEYLPCGLFGEKLGQ